MCCGLIATFLVWAVVVIYVWWLYIHIIYIYSLHEVTLAICGNTSQSTWNWIRCFKNLQFSQGETAKWHEHSKMMSNSKSRPHPYCKPLTKPHPHDKPVTPLHYRMALWIETLPTLKWLKFSSRITQFYTKLTIGKCIASWLGASLSKPSE